MCYGYKLSATCIFSQISFTHPVLLCPPLPPTLGVRLEQLFSTDYSEAALSAAEAHPKTPAKTGLRRRGCMIGHHRAPQQTNARARAVPDQCYLSLSLFPLSRLPGPAEPGMGTLLRLMERREFILNLTLGACNYVVTATEYEDLPQSLRDVVNGESRETGEGGGGGGGGGGGIGGGLQLQCLQLLCWVIRVQDGVAGTEGLQRVRGGVAQLLVSLFHACFFTSHSRRTAHYCSRIIISLYRSGPHPPRHYMYDLCTLHFALCRPHELSPSSEDFSRRLFSAISSLLPLLPACSSAACVRWFLQVVTMAALKSHDCHVILKHCTVLLVKLAGQLQTKPKHLPQLLQTQLVQYVQL